MHIKHCNSEYFYSISTLNALNSKLSPVRARHQRLRIAHFQRLPSAQIQPLQLDLFPAQCLKRGFNRAWQDLKKDYD